MPRVSHTASVRAPVTEVWNFVRSFDNWAAFIAGYSSHEVIDDTHSTWSIKGTAGAVTRTVTFDVEIVDWVEGDRVAFTLTGRSEPMTGAGSFVTVAAGGPGASVPPVEPARPGVLARLRARIGRVLGRRLLRSRPPGAPTPAVDPPAHDVSTSLTFDLELSAGGMMAPMINPMLEPMLNPVAEDLAVALTNAIEKRPA